ncbi:MAG: methyltransferase domain-containing protein [Alphaproteobacteria bacterium]|nr:methyltransferase domain-containing protein [Alphaproteobacteria bacterium]
MSVSKKLKKANSLRESGKNAQAFALYKEIVSLDPNHVDALYYLGLAARSRRDYAAAFNLFNRAINSEPQFAKGYFIIGLVYEETGDIESAVSYYLNALKREPENARYAYVFANTIKNLSFLQENTPVLESVTEILPHKNIESDRLSGVWISLFQHSAAYQTLLALTKTRQPSAEQINAAVNDQTFIMGLCYVLIMNIEFEHLLVHLRKNILMHLLPRDISIAFLAALALQNFHNEYIWDISAEETAALDALLAKTEAGKSDLHELLLLAAYMPLQRVESIAQYESLITEDTTGFGHNVWVQQVAEPFEELAIKPNIPQLTSIDDKISQAVQAQYEDNPYPRWKAIQHISEIDFKNQMKDRFNYLNPEIFNRLPNTPKVLIAGCGTGHQPLQHAQIFKGHKITAVDLSLASLAYAQRKKHTLAPKAEVSFAQADILRLGEAFEPESFDIIASSGVLHHMADPMAGWRVITKLLKPHGLMKIGLYSQHARKVVTQLREKIAADNIPSTPEGIRTLRQYIKARPDSAEYAWVTVLFDFYTLSDCRDLLFHVQEHQFTIPKIKAAIDELGLEFLGFEVENHAALNRSFLEMFPQSTLPGTLDEWNTYEQATPNAFRGMYEFWLKKAG